MQGGAVEGDEEGWDKEGERGDDTDKEDADELEIAEEAAKVRESVSMFF